MGSWAGDIDIWTRLLVQQGMFEDGGKMVGHSRSHPSKTDCMNGEG